MPDGRQVSSASSKTGVSPVLKKKIYNGFEYIPGVCGVVGDQGKIFNRHSAKTVTRFERDTNNVIELS